MSERDDVLLGRKNTEKVEGGIFHKLIFFQQMSIYVRGVFKFLAEYIGSRLQVFGRSEWLTIYT